MDAKSLVPCRRRARHRTGHDLCSSVVAIRQTRRRDMAGSLERRTLGRTGLDVTALGYGAMEIRGPRIWSGRDLTDNQAERILNTVLDAGINFIDTAYDYGRSEEYIGRFLGHRRSEYYLATKCGC